MVVGLFVGVGVGGLDELGVMEMWLGDVGAEHSFSLLE